LLFSKQNLFCLRANFVPGEQLQLLVKGGCWKTAILETGEFGLISEAVSPGFEYADMALITSQDVSTEP
jgi:predicted cupin superfamily sugar epimerase